MNETNPATIKPAASAKRARRKYDAPFKAAAVEHCRRHGGDLLKTAQELGINYWTLRDWMEVAKAPPESRPADLPQLQEENRRLKAELTRVTEQRDILKKSLGILSLP